MTIDELMNELGNILYGMVPSEAINQGICIKCKKPPQFKTPAGEDEYQLSALCEYCFDEEFGDDADV
jgi:hypothetical protein